MGHIVNGKAPNNPWSLNTQTGKMSTTSTNFTADNWIVDTIVFAPIASTILLTNWVKIYAVAKAINLKTWQLANAQIINLTVDEVIDKCVMIIDIPDSNETTSMAAPIAAVKDKPIDVSIDAGYHESGSHSGSHSGFCNRNNDGDEDKVENEEAKDRDEEEKEEENSMQDDIASAIGFKYHILFLYTFLIILQNLLIPHLSLYLHADSMPLTVHLLPP